MSGTEKHATLDREGREVLDDTPIVLHLPSGRVGDFDRIRDMIKQQLSLQAREEGFETLEEANDFDVDDDMFPVSPHEYSEGTEAADREALDVERARSVTPGDSSPDVGADGLATSRPGASAAAPAVESTSEPGVQPGSAT